MLNEEWFVLAYGFRECSTREPEMGLNIMVGGTGIA